MHMLSFELYFTPALYFALLGPYMLQLDIDGRIWSEFGELGPWLASFQLEAWLR